MKRITGNKRGRLERYGSMEALMPDLELKRLEEQEKEKEKEYQEDPSYLRILLYGPVGSDELKNSNSRRIVLLGEPGSGMSSLANTIFGERVFESDHKEKVKQKDVNKEKDLQGKYEQEKYKTKLMEELLSMFKELMKKCILV